MAANGCYLGVAIPQWEAKRRLVVRAAEGKRRVNDYGLPERYDGEFRTARARVDCARAASAPPSIPATLPGSAVAADEAPLDLLSKLETEEVEPGVLRIVSDGHRDLSGATAADAPETYAEYLDTHVARNLVVGRDGRVWVIEPDRLFRLGSPTDIRWPQPTRHVSFNDLEVSPDGRLWRLVPIRRLQSFDGETWRRHLQRQLPWSIEMEPDGTLWATWTESGVCFEPEGCTPTRLGRRDREGWSVVDIPKLYHYSGSHLAVTGDGEAWTCCKHDPQKHGPGLLRFDGRRWYVEQPATGVDADMVLRMDAAEDGTLWLRRSTSALERYRDGVWTVFTDADGVPPLGYTGSELQKLVAAPDGGVWVAPAVSTGHPDDELRCDGVAHFDGSIWTRYLRDTCVFSMDVAPDRSSGSKPPGSTSRTSTRTGSARPWSQSSPTPSGREVASARHPATEQDEQASTSTQRVPRERVRRFAFRAPESVRGRQLIPNL